MEMSLSDLKPFGIYHKLGFKLNSVVTAGKCLNKRESKRIYRKNDLKSNCMFVLSTPLGMVCRLKYIVSNRARPPSTAGLGYGKSENILFLIKLFTLL